jgi:pimeloyl-ACP methyl ester carboxylesterase
MYYVEAGAGEPLVLIMGFGGDHLAWGLQLQAFAATHRVIAFDNRGVGQTDSPDVPYTTGLMAEDTRGLMDRLGIERAHVLGVSMGGMIAQELALAHPHRVRSLQLHNTLARTDPYTRACATAWVEVREALPPEAALRAIALWLFAPATYNERPELVETIIQSALANPYPQTVTGWRRQREAVAAHDALARLGAIRCPTLVTAAEDDILIRPRASGALAEAIAGAEFVTIPRAGHVPFWEQADAFNRLCLEFLARHRS